MIKLLPIFLLYAIALSAALAWRGFRRGSPLAPGAASGPARSSALRLLVVGATGGTGRHLVTQALAQGHVVTALVRNPSRLQIDHPHLTVLQGDVMDYASVERAVQGQEAVVSALGHKRYFSLARILSEGTRNVLRAMEAHGVRRFVCETSLGIGDSAGRMGFPYTFFIIPAILPLYFWDKTGQERVIAASRAEWVIVRPGGLTDGTRRGAYRHGYDVGNFLWTVRIPRADVADFMLKQVTDDTYLGSAAGVCS
jgi:uncharacterized protein YbjT (DUF2867 family)